MKDFNADFYITIATVIPLIIVAINAFAFKNSQFAPIIRRLLKPGRTEELRTTIAFFLCILPFLLGVTNEWDVLGALHARNNLSSFHDGFIAFSTMVLLLIAVSGVIENVLNEMLTIDEHQGQPLKEKSKINPVE